MLKHLFLGLLMFLTSMHAHAISLDEALSMVKNTPCKQGETIDQTLEHSIRSHSQRDIGWRNFQEEGYIEIERAVMINKAAELRYRWKVDMATQSFKADNERAEKLCQSE
jgi:hypothetical protein